MGDNSNYKIFYNTWFEKNAHLHAKSIILQGCPQGRAEDIPGVLTFSARPGKFLSAAPILSLYRGAKIIFAAFGALKKVSV